jgi:hypothetical protein
MLLLPEEQTGEDWERSKSDALFECRNWTEEGFHFWGFKRLSIVSSNVFKYRPPYLEH